MGGEMACLKPDLQRAVQHNFGLAADGIGNFAVTPGHGQAHPQPNGFAEGLLGRKARGEVVDAPVRPALRTASPGCQFTVAKNSLGKTLAVAFETGADASHIANISTNPVNHQAAGTGTNASSMQRR